MRPSRRLLSTQGMTFVEVVLAFLLLAVVILAVLKMMTQQSDAISLSMYQSDLRSEVQRTVSEISRELRQAQRAAGEAPPSVAVPAAPINTTMTVFVPTDVDGANGVLDALGNTEWNTAVPIQYAYDAVARRLTRTQGGATQILAHDVASASFEDQQIDATLMADEIRIRLTLQRVTPYGRTVTANGNAVVRLRN